MNFTRVFPALLKHINRPECFLENTLFCEYLTAFERVYTLPERRRRSIGPVSKQLKVSLLEGDWLLSNQQHLF